jgi:hypothetical protein
MLTIVTGPPCAGKSTHVRKHAHPGDLVIDFDRIAQALGSPVAHGHGTHHIKVTLEARDAAITAAVRRHNRDGARVWIVDSAPLPSRRGWYARNGARFVDLTAAPAELHRRATADGRPPGWHDQIDQFLATGRRFPTQPRDPQPQARTTW